MHAASSTKKGPTSSASSEKSSSNVGKTSIRTVAMTETRTESTTIHTSISSHPSQADSTSSTPRPSSDSTRTSGFSSSLPFLGDHPISISASSGSASLKTSSSRASPSLDPSSTSKGAFPSKGSAVPIAPSSIATVTGATSSTALPVTITNKLNEASIFAAILSSLFGFLALLLAIYKCISRKGHRGRQSDHETGESPSDVMSPGSEGDDNNQGGRSLEGRTNQRDELDHHEDAALQAVDENPVEENAEEHAEEHGRLEGSSEE